MRFLLGRVVYFRTIKPITRIQRVHFEDFDYKWILGTVGGYF